jgi:hypothetical protein
LSDLYDDRLPSEIEADEPASQDPVADERKELKKRGRKIDQRKREDTDWWSVALSSPIGRRCIWTMIVEFGAFETTFGHTPAGFPDPNFTFYKMGARECGLKLWQRLEIEHTEMAILMRRENDPAFSAGAASR